MLIWRDMNGMTSEIEDETDEEMKEVWIGWPEKGGTLVSEYQNCVGKIKITDDIGRSRMAFTMEERCELLANRYGAVHYEDAKEYAGFANHHKIVSSRSVLP